ncbi:hypothetical protein J2T14_000768 [Paenibacillus harenae]|nr:hypothetical protein [Paenibacillus harenae]
MSRIDFKALLWGIVVVVLTSFAFSIILHAVVIATGLEKWQQEHEGLYYVILVAISIYSAASVRREVREKKRHGTSRCC